MFAITTKNKGRSWLVITIALALTSGWLWAVVYIQTHFHYTGKGSRDTYFETFVYSVTLAMALLELAYLTSQETVFKVLFLGLALLMILCIWLLFYLTGTIDMANLPSFDRPLDYLDLFPFLCAISLVSIHFSNSKVPE